MSFDFPASPIDGTIYAPPTGPQYQFSGGAWRVASSSVPIATAQTRNRLVNGAMQISQEYGETLLNSSLFFCADQWQTFFTTAAGTITYQHLASTTPRGSRYRLRINVVTAKPSLAAGDYMLVRQTIEGLKIADFLYGTAAAKQAILRFGFKAPAGTYALTLHNSASNRSYIALFTISAGQANIDTEQTLVLPGDAVGTWLNDTGIGLLVDIVLASGTTFQGATGWQAGNFYATATCSNGMATAGAVFELFDVGLYLDLLNTGIAPPWQCPDEAEELRACQRYYQKGIGTHTYGGYAAGSFSFYWSAWLPVTMRTTPACASGGISNSNTGGANYSGTSATQMVITVNSTAVGAFYAAFTPFLNSRM